MTSTTAAGLRRLPPFAHVSLRLLQDLVEFASLEHRELPHARRRKPEVIQVLDGGLEARHETAPTERVRRGHWYVADRHRTLRPLPGLEAVLRVRRFDADWLADACRASFTLARTIVPESARDLLGVEIDDDSRRTHRILLASDPTLPAPMQAVGELLAAGIARQFGEPAALVVLEQASITVTAWNGDDFIPVPLPPLDPTTMPTADVLEAIETALDTVHDWRHLVFVQPGDPFNLPEWWEGPTFHRVVYLTPDWTFGQTAPPHLLAALHADLWNAARHEGPFFSSFIPTAVDPPAPEPSCWALLPPPLGEGLATLEVIPVATGGDFAAHGDPVEPRWRLYRDRCVVRLELPALAGRWAGRAPGTGFAAAELGRQGTWESVARWARAVTNRQVGVALSGGGASSALLIPLLEDLVDGRVPIDVVSGVSGGTILGAYLCADGISGLTRYRRDGLWFQSGLMTAVVSSWFVEQIVDRLLPGARVEAMERRLVAVTTRLLDDTSPCATAVVRGTVGEAVRVSGAAPGALGPAERLDARYLDGATALPVPARVLPDFGADVAFAFNSIGPVKERNLLRAFAPTALFRAGVDLVYHTVVGRVVDSLVAYFTTLDSASREGADDADLYYSVPAEEIPLLDGFKWLWVDALAEAMAQKPHLWKPASDRCRARWAEFAAAPGGERALNGGGGGYGPPR